MDNDLKYFRFIGSNWMPFLSGVIFAGIFYLVYFVWGNTDNLVVSSYVVGDFVKKYGVFIPAVYSILTILVLYILYLIKWIVRLNFWIVNLLLLILVYSFSLIFGIQLAYFEPRYTDVAIFIIDSYAKSMIYASSGALIFSIITIFIKKKI